MERYKIIKIINNNIICSVDEKGHELILRGKGIGFGCRRGEWIKKDKVEMVYRMEDAGATNKLQELLSTIPPLYLDVSTEIITLAEITLNRRLNENIYLTLTDHIHFAIYRKKENMEYKNALLWEIKHFYPAEYQLGLRALSIIQENLGETLSTDEAGFIALHIVNAELDTKMDNMVQITQIISSVLSIVKDYYEIELDENSLDYERFITHLKFFGQRLFHKGTSAKDDPALFHMLKEQYFTDFHCAEQIRDYIRDTFRREVSDSEMIFLTIHLHRVTAQRIDS